MSEHMTLDEFRDEIYGPVGTPRRDRHDRNTQRWLRANDIASRVTRYWPGWMRVFWTRPIYDRSTRLRGFLDVMSFAYLGDFLFYGEPVTQEYADSWMSRVRFPRWLSL